MSTCKSLLIWWRKWAEIEARVVVVILIPLPTILANALSISISFWIWFSSFLWFPFSYREQTELKLHIQIACRSQWERLQLECTRSSVCILSEIIYYYDLAHVAYSWFGPQSVSQSVSSQSNRVSKFTSQSFSQQYNNSSALQSAASSLVRSRELSLVCFNCLVVVSNFCCSSLLLNVNQSFHLMDLKLVSLRVVTWVSLFEQQYRFQRVCSAMMKPERLKAAAW